MLAGLDRTCVWFNPLKMKSGFKGSVQQLGLHQFTTLRVFGPFRFLAMMLRVG